MVETLATGSRGSSTSRRRSTTIASTSAADVRRVETPGRIDFGGDELEAASLDPHSRT